MSRRLIARWLTAVAVTACATLYASPAQAAEWHKECYGNPGSNGMQCINVSTESGFAKEIVVSLTKNHANACSVPTITITATTDDPLTGPREATVVGPKICADRDFSWKHESLTSLNIEPKFCIDWSGFSPDVCQLLR